MNLSDARLKKDIRPIKGALSIVDHLQGVRFNWRTDSERTIGKNFSLAIGVPQVGFIAQQVETVLPEAVSVAKDGDGTMSVAESKIVPVLVEAVKELSTFNGQLLAASDKQAAEIGLLKTANDNETVQVGLLKATIAELQRHVGPQTAQR